MKKTWVYFYGSILFNYLYKQKEFKINENKFYDGFIKEKREESKIFGEGELDFFPDDEFFFRARTIFLDTLMMEYNHGNGAEINAKTFSGILRRHDYLSKIARKTEIKDNLIFPLNKKFKHFFKSLKVVDLECCMINRIDDLKSLQYYGSLLNNCMLDYRVDIMEGYCDIYSLEYENIIYAFEIIYGFSDDGKNRYFINQFYGYENTFPKKTLQDKLDRILARINKLE